VLPGADLHGPPLELGWPGCQFLEEVFDNHSTSSSVCQPL
jgi:hypothetical protein